MKYQYIFENKTIIRHLCKFACINSQLSLSKTYKWLNQYFKNDNNTSMYYVNNHDAISFDANITASQLSKTLQSLQPKDWKFIKIKIIGTVVFDNLSFLIFANPRDYHTMFTSKPNQPYVGLFDSMIDSCKFLEQLSIWFYIMTILLKSDGIIIFPELFCLPLRVFLVNLYRYFRCCTKNKIDINIPKSIIIQYNSMKHEDTRIANMEMDEIDPMYRRIKAETENDEFLALQSRIDHFIEGIIDYVPYIRSFFNYGVQRILYVSKIPDTKLNINKRLLYKDILSESYGNAININHVSIKKDKVYFLINKTALNAYLPVIEDCFDDKERTKTTFYELQEINQKWVNLFKCSFIRLNTLKSYNSKKMYDKCLRYKHRMERKYVFRGYGGDSGVYIGKKVGRVKYFNVIRKNRCCNFFCNLPNSFDNKYKVCSRCKVHTYCSRKCQKIAWLLCHRYYCIEH